MHVRTAPIYHLYKGYSSTITSLTRHHYLQYRTMSDEKRDPDAPPAYDHYLSPSTGVPLATKTKIPDSITTVVPRYACITVHPWDVLRFVNFTQRALAAVEGVVKLYYLNGAS
jgi:hypothetical protein